MIWLICGGRDFANGELFASTMARLVAERGKPSHVIHGAARGADSFADLWAHSNRVRVTPFPANWRENGRAAGAIRNAQMAALRPDLVIAFPGGRGTADMMARAEAAGLEVVRIT